MGNTPNTDILCSNEEGTKFVYKAFNITKETPFNGEEEYADFVIWNGLTLRDSYDYDIKKSQIESLDTGKFKEMALLEFEYECFKRELKVLASNFSFQRDDDFDEI